MAVKMLHMNKISLEIMRSDWENTGYRQRAAKSG